ncbi:MAG: LysM domain-containing protein [Sphaerobacter sp.]|nr:LysM domain-containing protein [Sphaerobacter sp.]
MQRTDMLRRRERIGIPAAGVRWRRLTPVLALGATLVVGCLPGRGETRVTPTPTASPTPIPMLTIVTPTPGPPPPPTSGAEATKEPAPDNAGAASTYVVQPGDTLYGIAVKLNVDPQALADANGITDPNALQAGQVLTVPGRGEP